jgi:hypothetical protein
MSRLKDESQLTETRWLIDFLENPHWFDWPEQKMADDNEDYSFADELKKLAGMELTPEEQEQLEALASTYTTRESQQEFLKMGNEMPDGYDFKDELKELADNEKVLDFLRQGAADRKAEAERIRREDHEWFLKQMAVHEKVNELLKMLNDSVQQMIRKMKDPSAPDTVHTPEFFTRLRALSAESEKNKDN